MIYLIPLFAIITPLILWPIEIFLPYPYVVEEAAKAILLSPLLIHEENRLKMIKLAIVVGLLFAVSESVLYLFNIALVGSISTFFMRLLITVPFHILTSVIIILPATFSKKLIIAGLVLAILLHYFFNIYISSIALIP